jgi:hypothetical protein
LPRSENARTGIDLKTLAAAGVPQNSGLSVRACRSEASSFLPEPYGIVVYLVAKTADS